MRGEPNAAEYADIPGFCKSTTTDEIARHDHKLTPGRYVGAEDIVDKEEEPFDEKIEQLASDIFEQFALSARLEANIKSNLKGLNYGA